MPDTRQEILLAYRHLYQHALRAVQYSTPSRLVVRSRIRSAFRNSSPDDFDPVKTARTLEFLDGAARTKGLEHRIVKNLMHVWWERSKRHRIKVRKHDLHGRLRAYDSFDLAIEKLNESMNMCIK